jgi:DNA invertase Pin-like site-specific DNA recombinase
MATFGYRRVSTAEQTNGTSLDSQQAAIEAAATMRGEAIAHVFTDDGVSASIPFAKRPEGAALFERVEAGDTIIATKLDRMFRNSLDALNTLDALRERGVDLVLLDLGTSSVTTNGIGRVLFTVMGAFAQFDRERIKERQAEGIAAKRAKNGHVGGLAPFGYKTVGEGKSAILITDEGEQKTIAHARKLRAEGLTLRRIADQLAREGHLSRAGTKLNPATIRAITKEA